MTRTQDGDRAQSHHHRVMLGMDRRQQRGHSSPESILKAAGCAHPRGSAVRNSRAPQMSGTFTRNETENGSSAPLPLTPGQLSHGRFGPTVFREP